MHANRQRRRLQQRVALPSGFIAGLLTRLK